MAILGVLAVVVLVAINPVQQLARTRDAGRKSSVTQLGHALEAFYTSHGGSYLSTAAGAGFCDFGAGGTTSFIQCLVDAGELSSIPSAITNTLTSPCVEAGTDPDEVNEYCYDQNGSGSEALVVTALESNSEDSKCTTASNIPWFVWSTVQGRGGLVCSDTQPVCAAGACSVSFNTTQ
jgi:hypothetical protein